MNREFTGRHALAVFCGAFAVIIGVNLVLAWQAVATFPGLVVANSYVASQNFDAERAAQDGLGWTVDARISGGLLQVRVSDVAGIVRPASISATLGRATNMSQDSTPAFDWTGEAYAAAVDLVPGYWTLWLEMTAADGTGFRRRMPLMVSAADRS